MATEKEYSMEEIQASLLEMMKVFHRVCEENNIVYYMNSGTVLGAIRHGDFIPWDDDVDLGLYREQYEKLLALPEQVWGENYRLATFHSMEGYPFCYAKLYDVRTTKVENAYGFKKWTGGIYLDIFPHDGAGNSRFSAVIRYRWNFIKLWFLLYSMLEKRQRNPIKRILQWIAGRKSVFKRQCDLEKAMKAKSVAKSRYVSNFIGKHRTREVFDKRLFGKPTLYPFADTEFYGPERVEEYLTQLYGNYMELPPENERETVHPGEVDLKHSFLEK